MYSDFGKRHRELLKVANDTLSSFLWHLLMFDKNTKTEFLIDPIADVWFYPDFKFEGPCKKTDRQGYHALKSR